MESLSGAPFPTGWWSFDLGQYRPCDGTYQLYPSESLPPLPEPNESLEWLTPLSDELDSEMEVHRNAPEERGALEAIAAAARERGLTLPPSFIRLMSSPALQDRIPSCTACTFELGDHLEPCPGADSAYIIPFLRDQQDCVLWYLYLTPGGGHCALAFPGDMDEYIEAVGKPDAKVTMADIAGAIRVCAPSFASFIYRFWLENTIWFKLNSSDAAPYTPTEQAYLDFYAQRRAAQN
jgi:hypothetical protein